MIWKERLSSSNALYRRVNAREELRCYVLSKSASSRRMVDQSFLKPSQSFRCSYAKNNFKKSFMLEVKKLKGFLHVLMKKLTVRK